MKRLFLSKLESIKLDRDLMSEKWNFKSEQLIELAGELIFLLSKFYIF